MTLTKIIPLSSQQSRKQHQERSNVIDRNKHRAMIREPERQDEPGYSISWRQALSADEIGFTRKQRKDIAHVG